MRLISTGQWGKREFVYDIYIRYLGMDGTCWELSRSRMGGWF